MDNVELSNGGRQACSLPSEVCDSAGSAIGVQLALQPAWAGKQLLKVLQPACSHQVMSHILQHHAHGLETGAKESLKGKTPMALTEEA